MPKSQQDATSLIQILQAKLTLICDMCNHPVSHPRICSSCKEIFCYQCLVNYHQSNHNCPLCHEKHGLGQFMEFDSGHVLEYFRRQLKQLKIGKQVLRQSAREEGKMLDYGKSQKQKEQQEKCLQHEIPVKYFCETCSKAICADCGMMSSHHKGHKFIRLNDIYTKIRQKLNSELSRLSSKIAESHQQSSSIKQKLQKLQIEHMHIKRYTQEYYILLVQKFEQQIATKSVLLKQLTDKNNSEIQFYELYRNGICEEIERKSRDELIKDAEQMLTSFAIQTFEPPEPVRIQEAFETVKELLPEYNNFQYELKDFMQCGGGIVYSDSFVLNGVEWRLKIYPRGNGVAKGKYLSVFVEMSKAERSQKKYEYKIQLLNKQLPGQNIRRQYCSAFDIGQCWGYNQFILLQELTSNGYLEEDGLRFVMGIRNPDYRTLSQDQANYIARLESQVKLKQVERENQVEETNIIDELDNHAYSMKGVATMANETKFLKFLQNSSFNQERINERRLKQRQKQLERSEKDQDFEDFPEDQPRCKTLSKTTNNLQVSDVIEVKPERNQFLINDYSSLKSQEFTEFDQTDFNIKAKPKRVKGNRSTDQDKSQKIYRHSVNLLNQQMFAKDKKTDRNSLMATDQKHQLKLQIKQDRPIPKNQQQISDKYQVYFSTTKKSQLESKKDSRKYDSSKNAEEDYFLKRQLKYIQTSKTSKNEPKQIRKIPQTKTKLKIQDEKLKKYDQDRIKKYEQQKAKRYPQQKFVSQAKDPSKTQQQKKDNIKTKKYIKSSPPKSKNEMEESQNRKKQISQILQQSKKLQGIGEEKVNCFISNMSEVKDSGPSGSMLRSPVKTSQLRHEREEGKPSLKKLKEFEFERN